MGLVGMNGTNISLLFFGYTNQNNPYSRIMLPVLKTLCKEGANIEVFSLTSDVQGVEEEHKGVKVESCPTLFKSKSLNYVAYCFFSIFYVLIRALKDTNTIFIVPSTPPVLLGLVVTIVKALTFGRVKWLYHVQDIHPEINFIEKQEGVIDKALISLDKVNCKSADLIVTLSADMQKTLVANRGVDSDKIIVLNNFLDSLVSASDPLELDGDFTESYLRDRERNRTIFVYSGNVGPYQNLEPVIRFFAQGDESAVLYVIGAGKEYKKIASIVSNSKKAEQIRLFGEKAFDEANLLASLCDYGVVSLARNVSKYVYPSKLGCYLSLGLPVACFLEKDSKVASDVLESELGIVIGNNYKTLTADELDAFWELEAVRLDRREYFKDMSKKLFSKNNFVIDFKNCLVKINVS